MTAQNFPPVEVRQENITMVLVSPKNPGNVGAVARAIKNMGFRDLRLVNPWSEIWLEAIRMACGAEDLLEKAKITTNLEEALEDIHWVVGTTARKRRYHKNVFSPQEIVEKAVSLCQNNKIAFLFGSEKYGLTTKEMSFCHQVVTIPTQENFSSLNLSQAVLIIAWELSKALENHSDLRTQPKLASHKELYDFFTHLEQVLRDIEFLNVENARHMMFSIKKMVYQKALTSQEVKILRGILRQLHRSHKLGFSHGEIANHSI